MRLLFFVLRTRVPRSFCHANSPFIYLWFLGEWERRGRTFLRHRSSWSAFFSIFVLLGWLKYRRKRSGTDECLRFVLAWVDNHTELNFKSENERGRGVWSSKSEVLGPSLGSTMLFGDCNRLILFKATFQILLIIQAILCFSDIYISVRVIDH